MYSKFIVRESDAEWAARVAAGDPRYASRTWDDPASYEDIVSKRISVHGNTRDLVLFSGNQVYDFLYGGKFIDCYPWMFKFMNITYPKSIFSEGEMFIDHPHDFRLSLLESGEVFIEPVEGYKKCEEIHYRRRPGPTLTMPKQEYKSQVQAAVPEVCTVFEAMHTGKIIRYEMSEEAHARASELVDFVI